MFSNSTSCSHHSPHRGSKFQHRAAILGWIFKLRAATQPALLDCLSLGSASRRLGSNQAVEIDLTRRKTNSGLGVSI